MAGQLPRWLGRALGSGFAVALHGSAEPFQSNEQQSQSYAKQPQSQAKRIIFP
jgi:hypothetical protein